MPKPMRIIAIDPVESRLRPIDLCHRDDVELLTNELTAFRARPDPTDALYVKEGRHDCFSIAGLRVLGAGLVVGQCENGTVSEAPTVSETEIDGTATCCSLPDAPYLRANFSRDSRSRAGTTLSRRHPRKNSKVLTSLRFSKTEALPW